jgi:hypothetical protein
MKKFNINDHIYIQITEEGWKHLRETVGADYIKHCIRSCEKVIDGEVWFRLQCWSVFDILPISFGSTTPLFKSNVMFDDEAFEDM